MNFLGKLKMFKKDPTLFGFLKTSSMRQLYCGANGKIKRKQMNVFIDLLNDKHRIINFVRFLLILSKLA
jgi:hypothetical protein